MRFPARRNLGPGIVKSPSAARNRTEIFLTKLGSGVALEGGRRRETGPSAPQRSPEVPGEWPKRQT